MDIKLTQSVVKSRYPKEYALFVNELRASGTKSKDTLEQDFKCSYSWGEIIQSETFDQILLMLENMSKGETSKSNTPLTTRIKNRIQNSRVALVIKAWRFQRRYLVSIPQEVCEIIKQQEEKNESLYFRN